MVYVAVAAIVVVTLALIFWVIVDPIHGTRRGRFLEVVAIILMGLLFILGVLAT